MCIDRLDDHRRALEEIGASEIDLCDTVGLDPFLFCAIPGLYTEQICMKTLRLLASVSPFDDDDGLCVPDKKIRASMRNAVEWVKHKMILLEGSNDGVTRVHSLD